MDVSQSDFRISSDARLGEELDRLRSELGQVREENTDLNKQNAKLENQKAKLEKQNKQLERKNAKLQAENEQLKKENEDRERNSKRQTSRFPRRKRKTNPKKPGRKKGTKATHRKRPAKVDRELDVPAGNCPDCCCRLEGILTVTGYQRRVEELENRLDDWIRRNEPSRQPDLARLARHLQKHRTEWFMFLYDPLVPPTNNHAERILRPAVIIRKLGGCNKSDAGARVHSVLASFMVSCRQQGTRFRDFAHRLFHAADPLPIPLASLPDG